MCLVAPALRVVPSRTPLLSLVKVIIGTKLMATHNDSRRTALKLLLAGSVVSMGTACSALNSLPRNHSGGMTDGSELALRVRKALREHPYTNQLTVDIKSSGDTVVLKGFVNSQNDVDNLDLVANQVEGVRHAQINVYVRE